MAAPTTSEYFRAVARARKLEGAMRVAQGQHIQRAIAQWLDEVDKALRAAKTTAAVKRLTAQRGILAQAAARMDVRLSNAISGGRSLTFREVNGVLRGAMRETAKLAGGSLGRIATPSTTMFGAFDSLGAPTTWRTLIKTASGQAAQEAGQIIGDAIIKGGADPRKVARQLRSYVQGSTPFAKAFGDTVDLRKIPRHLRGAAGRMVHNAERIAYTEIHNARAEAEVQHFRDDPIVEAVRWMLSPDRGALKSSDECDILAQSDLYGMGPGVYPVGAVPITPHPFDRCERMPVTRPPKKWNARKPSPRRTGKPIRLQNVSRGQQARAQEQAHRSFTLGEEISGTRVKTTKRVVKKKAVKKKAVKKTARPKPEPKPPPEPAPLPEPPVTTRELREGRRAKRIVDIEKKYGVEMEGYEKLSVKGQWVDDIENGLERLRKAGAGEDMRGMRIHYHSKRHPQGHAANYSKGAGPNGTVNMYKSAHDVEAQVRSIKTGWMPRGQVLTGEGVATFEHEVGHHLHQLAMRRAGFDDGLHALWKPRINKQNAAKHWLQAMDEMFPMPAGARGAEAAAHVRNVKALAELAHADAAIVSGYGETNAVEFVAEYFQGRMAGLNFGSAADTLYARLNGRVLKWPKPSPATRQLQTKLRREAAKAKRELKALEREAVKLRKELARQEKLGRAGREAERQTAIEEANVRAAERKAANREARLKREGQRKVDEAARDARNAKRIEEAKARNAKVLADDAKAAAEAKAKEQAQREFIEKLKADAKAEVEAFTKLRKSKIKNRSEAPRFKDSREGQQYLKDEFGFGDVEGWQHARVQQVQEMADAFHDMRKAGLKFEHFPQDFKYVKGPTTNAGGAAHYQAAGNGEIVMSEGAWDIAGMQRAGDVGFLAGRPDAVGALRHEMGHRLHHAGNIAVQKPIGGVLQYARLGEENVLEAWRRVWVNSDNLVKHAAFDGQTVASVRTLAGKSIELRIVAREVSEYAMTMPSEFVAEVYSGILHGKKYSDAVMNLYRALSGPTTGLP